MSWRFVTWNLDWWQKHPERVPRSTVLERLDASVVALQEVKGGVAKALRATHRGPTVFSQEVHSPATWRWMGCGLLFKADTRVIDSGVVTTLPKPQRSLWVRLQLPNGPELTAVSWHTPNAAGNGRAVKMEAYAAMSEWLSDAPRPLVLGADLNTWQDPVDLIAADPTHPFHEEHEFVGPHPKHELVDAYRTVLEGDGTIDQMRASASTGPLAVSYVLADGAEHRMDRIFASPELNPVAGDYDFETARQGGSDHALHWIDFD